MNMSETKNNPTKQQLAAGLDVIRAVAEAIRELRTVPSGNLYAHVMGRLSIQEYEKVIGILKGADLVRESSDHLLTWVAA
jgi:hypothetical protein